MGFEGMDTDAGKDVASALKTVASEVVELWDGVTTTVNGVEWEGADYDSYVEEWQAFISGPVSGLGELFTAKSDELQQDADEQDSTSSA